MCMCVCLYITCIYILYFNRHIYIPINCICCMYLHCGLEVVFSYVGKTQEGFTHEKERGLRPSPAASVVFRWHQPTPQQGPLLQGLCSHTEHS